ncbi:MAG TPA: FAD-binding oxidoreductase [Paracoccaceae bacterium]|nr:FAD-binding oxidoreductase [Paracoccaceae bacterium]
MSAIVADGLARHAVVAPPAWPADIWHPMVCRAVRDETHDVKSFVFEPAVPGCIGFDPGQSLTFRLTIGGEAVERCYTIASSAAIRSSIEITVKRKPGGRVSNHLHDQLRPGDILEAMGPNGGFTLADHPGGKYLLISAGSGITPMASILRSLADLKADRDIVLLHAARSPRDVIFAGELAGLCRRVPGLRVQLAASAVSPADHWTGAVGRIDGGLLARAVPDLASRIVFCCGPEPFMAAMRQLAADGGVPPQSYVEESFQVAEDDVPVMEAACVDAAPVTVTLAKSGKHFSCAAGATILEAARAAGVPMPSSCRRGICGTCKTKKLSGSVVMAHGGGIRQREIDQGMILPCCSRPQSDLVLDR